MFSASSEARDRNAPTNANQIRLQTSRIRQEHRPIRYQLPARLSFRQGQEAQLPLVSGRSTLAEAIRYALSRWEGLTRFLNDGRIELDTNPVERAIRPVALGRKNHLFAGSDGGAEHWAVLASLIATCKLNDVNPQTYLANVLSRIVNRHPMSRLDELLPFAYVKSAPAKAVA